MTLLWRSPNPTTSRAAFAAGEFKISKVPTPSGKPEMFEAKFVRGEATQRIACVVAGADPYRFPSILKAKAACEALAKGAL